MGFKVEPNFRTNELSLTPGGVTVEVIYKDGRIYEYSKKFRSKVIHIYPN